MALTTIDDRGLKTPIDLLDNEKIRFGTGNDLELYHDASHSRIKDTGTGYLIINTDTGVLIKNGADDEGIAYFTPNGAVELMYDNSKKLETTSTGISTQGNCIITGHFYGPDNSELRLGSADDFKLYHDGTNNYIKSANDNQDILIQSSKDLYLATGDGSTGIHTFLYAADNAGVELRYDNSKKFETNAGGVDVTGVMQCDGITLLDNEQFQCGTNVDLRIYHDSSNNNTYIKESGAGNLYIYSANLRIMSADGSEAYIEANSNGNVELFYDNSKKLSTVSTGVKIENAGNNRVLKLDHTDGDYCYITFMDDDTSDDGQVRVGALNNELLLLAGGSERARVRSDGHLEIKDGNLIIETAGHGINFHPHSGTDNLLDDYEIGTFTPTIQGTGSANACTYTAQSGKYTKVGRLVTVDLKVSWSAKTADSGSAIVNGLPFTIGANSYAGGAFAIYSSNFTSGGSAVTAMTEPSSGNTYFYAALVSFDNTTWNNESAVNMWENGTGHYRANFTYMV